MLFLLHRSQTYYTQICMHITDPQSLRKFYHCGKNKGPRYLWWSRLPEPWNPWRLGGRGPPCSGGRGLSFHWCPSHLPIKSKSTHEIQHQASNVETISNLSVWPIFSLVSFSPANYTHIRSWQPEPNIRHGNKGQLALLPCQSHVNLFYSWQPASSMETTGNLKIMACLLSGGLLPCQSQANMTTSLKASNKGHGLSSHWWPPSLPINVNMTTSLKASDKGCGLSSHWCPHSLPIKRRYDNQPQGIKQRAWSVFSLVPSSPAHHTHSWQPVPGSQNLQLALCPC